MDLIDTLGFVAAICTTISFIPQAIKVLKTGETKALSVTMYSLFTFGVALWLAYGWIKNDAAMIFANTITLVLAIAILYQIVRNLRSDKSER
ncbi:glutathione synthetase [Saccharobesus litoralis]|uniref:Glutathione synthetase n=2 Tax=Saccharobesus litoralis TaxID=2172099 RepID=A0A2S0VQ00_9ALTE|nr:glutathione synthetase [Saccharobesus litoralis]